MGENVIQDNLNPITNRLQNSAYRASQPASQPAGQTELSKKGVKANVDM